MNQATINRLRRQAAAKREVAARHTPGSSYYTRAMREAEALEAKADKLENSIQERRNQ